jgi:molybdopterin converting factor small subunit
MVANVVRAEIRYYAQLREKLGLSREEVELTLPAGEQEILDRLAGLHPAVESLLRASRLAVDDEYLPRGAVIRSLASADVISPVSGG